MSDRKADEAAGPTPSSSSPAWTLSTMLTPEEAELRRAEQQRKRAAEYQERVRRYEAEAPERQREERRRRLLQLVTDQGGPRYHPDLVSLDNYEVKHKGQDIILGKVRALAGRLPEAVKAGESFIFCGT